MEDNGNQWFYVLDFYSADSCGVANFDGTTWTFYNTSNSGLPSDLVYEIAIDHDGNKWFGTLLGIAMFDGVNWIVYDTSNSGLPVNVGDIAIDPEGNKWFATIGVTMFDGANWLNYNTGNSGLPSDHVTCIAFDDNGNKWFGTYDAGLARFDGTNWTVYNTTNSGLVSDRITSISTDNYGNLWAIVFQNNGVAMFDGSNWTIYNSANSPLPSDDVDCMVIDTYGNKWFGFYYYGAVVFNENGVITHTARQEPTVPSLTAYPNPFSGMLNIGYSLTETRKVVINLYSSEGKLIKNICSGLKPKGDYKESVDGTNLPAGIYIITLTLNSCPVSRKVIKID
jgi:ligand-binding sensor domain-containing protein